jgi:uncharacterized protein
MANENPKKYFALKLIPPRPGFTTNMNEEERSIMNKHVAYWARLMEKGIVVAIGPVLDPKDTYGLAIIEVDSEEQVIEYIKNDPVLQITYYESYPMLAKVRKLAEH